MICHSCGFRGAREWTDDGKPICGNCSIGARPSDTRTPNSRPFDHYAMRHRYYYSGGKFEEATIHRDKHCSELEEPKPLADSTAESIDADWCPECTDAESQSESESKVSEESETCDVVKSDGDVCGRELPCGYHSDEES